MEKQTEKQTKTLTAGDVLYTKYCGLYSKFGTVTSIKNGIAEIHHAEYIIECEINPYKNLYYRAIKYAYNFYLESDNIKREIREFELRHTIYEIQSKNRLPKRLNISLKNKSIEEMQTVYNDIQRYLNK